MFGVPDPYGVQPGWMDINVELGPEGPLGAMAALIQWSERQHGGRKEFK